MVVAELLQPRHGQIGQDAKCEKGEDLASPAISNRCEPTRHVPGDPRDQHPRFYVEQDQQAGGKRQSKGGKAVAGGSEIVHERDGHASTVAELL